MSDWTTEHMQLIQDCEERDQWLTDWERGFLDSISSRLADGRALTEPQAEKLDVIWQRVTANG